MGWDVHKRSITACLMNKEKVVLKIFKFDNNEKELVRVAEEYREESVLIETSTAGKYVARFIRDRKVDVHLVSSKNLAVISQSHKKTDRNDSIELAKLMVDHDFNEAYLPTDEIDEIRTLVRYRKSLGEENTIIKNKVHAILTLHGIMVQSSDIFGNRSLTLIKSRISDLPESSKVVVLDLLERYKELKNRIEKIEGMLSSSGMNKKEIKLLMTIPGINIYSATGVYSEIGDIGRFPNVDKFASYCGMVPIVEQSGEVTHYGKITKNGPSLLRFFLVLAAHTLIKMCPEYRKKYLRIMKRRNKYVAIVAVARSLSTAIYSMLKNGREFIHDYSELNARKIKNMESSASRVKRVSTEDMQTFIENMRVGDMSG
ncbi:MAG: IS110 family RNA-guided transposase [Cuniculiplasma sp.]